MPKRDPFDPWDEEFWALKVGLPFGAIAGFIVGAVVGFQGAGIGGAILGVILGTVIGGIVGIYLGGAFAYIPTIIGFLLGVLVLVGGIGTIVWLIHILWDVR